MIKAFFISLGLLLASNIMAQEKYTFVFLHNKPDKEKLSDDAVAKLMQGHMDNINRLAKEGKLLAAGPFDGGGGLFIFKSTSTEEVKGWLQTDPGIHANRWNIEILSYQPMVGGICPVGEQYEMTSYWVVHYQPQIYKFNVQEAGSLSKEHEKYVKTLPSDAGVVTYASFGDLDGGILVTKSETDEAWIQKDPSVSGSLFIPQKKKLYIAKGSFCEK